MPHIPDFLMPRLSHCLFVSTRWHYSALTAWERVCTWQETTLIALTGSLGPGRLSRTARYL
eukprot:4689642-Amphidinium_carterae.1